MELIKLIQKYKAATSMFGVLHPRAGLLHSENMQAIIDELKSALNQDSTDEEKKVIRVLLNEYVKLITTTIRLLKNNQSINNR